MRISLRIISLAVLAACGDKAATPDAAPHPDAPRDAPHDTQPVDVGLDAYVNRYPMSSAELHALVGGTWSVGWLADEASGMLNPVFGTMKLTPNGTPGYGVAGPVDANDKAVQIATNTDYFEGDDSLFPGTPDHANTDDVCAMWVGRIDAAGSVPSATILGNWASDDQGWFVIDSGAGTIQLVKNSTTENDACPMPPAGSWYVGLAAFEHAQNTMRLAIRSLDDVTVCTGAGASLTNFIGPFGPPKLMRLGKGLGTEIAKLESIAAYYVGVGPGACTGMTAVMGQSTKNLVLKLTTGANP